MNRIGTWVLVVVALQQLSSAAIGLTPSRPSPQPVGELIAWSADGATSSQDWFRFRYRKPGEEFRIIRDFGPGNSIDWAAAESEGPYEVEVAARSSSGGEIQTAIYTMQFVSRAGAGPAVTPTAHALVMLFSAQPCPAGGYMAVAFASSEGRATWTPWKECRSGFSMNFYLAGLRADTAHVARAHLDLNGVIQAQPDIPFRTGRVTSNEIPSASVVTGAGTPAVEGLTLYSTLFPNRPFAVNRAGDLLWYYPGVISLLTRPSTGGTFFGLTQTPGDQSVQRIREFDLTGMTVRETNAARLNEQLAERGMQPISGFHHEVRRLRDGKILALASSERMLSDVQGPGEVDVLGDTILVLDENLQLLWAWDSFDHLDVSRPAVLDEKCSIGSCPPIYLAPDANDWLHANSVELTPDGNLLVSFRHLDLVIKIDYQNGSGSGAVLWRLGKDGDFLLESGDPELWFSHQHDAEFDVDSSTLTIFDNGNSRFTPQRPVNSRGQVIRIDESSRTARFVMNADLGAYAFALGSAQALRNGNFHFDIGWLDGDTSLSVETDPSGRQVYATKVTVPVYRSFRMLDLYTEF